MKQKTRAWTAVLCLIVAGSGCATASRGTSQTIQVGSNPEGAECVFTREGETLGKLTTPGPITVKRDKRPIKVVCTKDGHEEARAFLNSLTDRSIVVGPGIIGAVTGVSALVDMASGADTHYQTALMVKLDPLSGADRAAAARPPNMPPASAPALPAGSSIAAAGPAPTMAASAGSATSAQGPMMDSKHRSEITVAGRVFPLLDGEWTVVATGTAHGTKFNTPIDRLYLAQMSGDRLARWMYISTNTARNPGNWERNGAICDRTNVQAGYSDTMNNTGVAECWILNRVGNRASANPSQVQIDFDRWGDSHSRPSAALALSYYFAKGGDFFRVDYYFNPEIAGGRDMASASTGEALFAKLKGVLK